jgi:hypothetical protein
MPATMNPPMCQYIFLIPGLNLRFNVLLTAGFIPAAPLPDVRIPGQYLKLLNFR